MTRNLHAAGLFGLLAITALAPAGAVAGNVVYRCTAADGTVTLQNAEACPAGQRQQVIEVDVAPPLPAFVPAQPPPGLRVLPVTAVAPSADEGTGAVATAEPVPPPPLYQCTRWDNERYLTGDAVPATRCRPLNTVGIGGLPTLGAGQACEQVEDSCTAVPEENLCRAWKSRVDEAEFRFKVTPAQSPAARERQQEYAALAATSAASTCVR